MTRQIPSPCERSLLANAVLTIHLFTGTTSALAAETPSFPYPVSTANRRFINQTGKVYLLKTMSSWAMSQNCSDAEITQALEGLKALKFNAVTVSPFGVHMNDSFGDRYRNKAGQSFFTDKPHASSLGPAWSSMDWIMREATRLELTVVFSFFLSWKDTGTVPDMIAGGTTNGYNFGKAVATRYASYSNIVWHVMGDYKWRYNDGPALALDAIFHGIRDAEGSNHRLIIAEPANGSTPLTSSSRPKAPMDINGSSKALTRSISTAAARLRSSTRSITAPPCQTIPWSTSNLPTSMRHIIRVNSSRNYTSGTTPRSSAAEPASISATKSGGRMA